jgi:putative FmdB family regulatory protein
MTYVYHCSHCDKTIEVEKSISEASSIEYCKCGDEMAKVYSLASIKTNDGVK